MKNLGEKTFDAFIKENKHAIVDFWADWCSPCSIMATVLDTVESKYDGTVAFGRVNVDTQADIANRFNITSIPTLLFFKSGKIQDHAVGTIPRKKLIERLDRFLISQAVTTGWQWADS